MPRTESCGCSTGTIGTRMFMRVSTVAALVKVSAVCSPIAFSPVPVDASIDLVFIPKIIFVSFWSLAFALASGARNFFLLGIRALGGNMPCVVASEAFRWRETLVFHQMNVCEFLVFDPPNGCPLGRGYLALSG